MNHHIVILIAIIALLSICIYRNSSEAYGSYITPKQVYGAALVGSTSMWGAVEESQPREGCLRRCLGAISLQTMGMDETEADLRKQTCYGMC